MPYLETPYELAEKIADMCGVYGAYSEEECVVCRICFVEEITERIRQSIVNEQYLDRQEVAVNGGTE